MFDWVLNAPLYWGILEKYYQRRFQAQHHSVEYFDDLH